MGWVRDLLRKEPGDWFFGPVLPAGKPGPDTGGTPVEPESAYISLYLEAMRLPAVRVRGQSFYGTVASTCTIQTRSGQPVQLTAISTPAALRGADPAHLDRVVTGTIPLIDSVPYRGGALDAEIGLFSLPGSYLLGPYLDLLSEVATVATAFLSPAGALASAALIPSVRKGLDHILGATTGARLEIGLAHAWDPPVTGHSVVVGAPEPAEGFGLRSDGRLLAPDGSEIRAAYMVLRLQARTRRNNWASIPDIHAAYQVIAEAARRGDLVAAREALAAFHRTTVFSSDLLTADAQRLWQLVDGQVKQAFQSTPTGAQIPGVTLPALADIPLYPESLA
jgi:hypothetical protein